MAFLAGILGSGKKSQAQQVNAAAGLQVQTSVQGKPVALGYGTNRIAPNLIWYGDFVATQVQSSSGGGGKGGATGGGGKGGGGSVSYTYTASFELGICEGPIASILSVYVNKNVTSLGAQGMGLINGSFGQAPWSYLIEKSGAINEVHTVTGGTVTVNQSSAFLLNGSVVKGTWTQLTRNNDYPFYTPSSGQYSIQLIYGQHNYTFNAAQASETVRIQYSESGVPNPAISSFVAVVPNTAPYIISISDSFENQYVDQGTFIYGSQTLTPVGGTPASGQYSVASNGVYTFNAAQNGASVTIQYYVGTGNGAAIGYSGFALVTAAAFSLGNNPQLPNFNFEVQARLAGLAIPQSICREPGTVPGSGTPQLQVRYGGNFLANVQVTDTAGNVYGPVGSSPGNGQYTVNGSGVYTFNANAAGVQLLFSYTANNGPDAPPGNILIDMLTSTQYGVGFPSARLGSWTNYLDYCVASGLLMSPFYTDQTQASSMLSDITTNTNSEFVWSAGQLFIVPYGDQTITQFGYTYTPPSSPEYSLTDDDFMPNTNSTGGSSSASNDDPVLMTRMAPANAYNALQGEFLDCGNSYNPALVDATDLAAVQQYGRQQDSTHQMHMYTNMNAAKLAITLQLQRQMVRNQYQFTLDQRYMLLDPMDIVAITDTMLGLNQQWVRLLEITENDDGTFSIVAEEYLQGTGHAPAYSFQTGTGFQSNYNVSPGDANTPVIFEPPIQATESGGPEAWIGVSGGPSFGGAQIYISTDGNTFKLAGQVNGNARMGMLLENLPYIGSPDTVNPLEVDLSESGGQLLSGTQNDADNFHTLCAITDTSNGSLEMVSYENANLIGNNQYALSYLQRGIYGTTAAEHFAGDNFLRCDAGVFAYVYDKSKVGQTIYVKVCAFNTYQGSQQSPADVEATLYTLIGPPLPGQVQGFQAQQIHDVVAFSWVDLPNDVGLKGYDIAYGVVGSMWEQKQLLTEAARGTEMTNASVPPGLWEFSIRGHDVVDHLSPLESLVELTVTNTNQIILSASEEPNWLGSNGDNYYTSGLNFTNHYAGTLAPMSQFSCDNYQPYPIPAAPTITSYIGGSIPAGTVYLKVTIVTLSGETPAGPETFIVVTGAQGINVTSPSPTGIANLDRYLVGYNVYASTSSGTEVLQNATPIQAGSGVSIGSLTVGTQSPPISNSTGYEWADIFVPDPYNFCFYAGVPQDTGLNAENRVYFTYKALPGPGESDQPYDVSTYLSYWLTGGTAPASVPWVLGFAECRYVWGFLSYVVSPVVNEIDPGNVCYFTDFTIIVDDPPATETNSGGSVPVIALFTTTGNVTSGSPNVTSIASMTGIVVGLAIQGTNIPIGTYVLSVNIAGNSLVMSTNATGNGTTQGLTFATFILFPTPYHFAPVVQVTPVSGTAQSATSSNETNLGFTPLLWNGGTNVAGAINWSATGQ